MSKDRTDLRDCSVPSQQEINAAKMEFMLGNAVTEKKIVRESHQGYRSTQTPLPSAA